jgi:predicted nucleic acid-binding Zn ribbon protein
VEVIASGPLCHACGAVFGYCMSCQIMVTDEKATVCPECGAPLKKGKKK